MTAGVIEIDGSAGEGGGQVLRTALALSIATGKPFRMTKVRAGRAKPGLMRQHLTCINAAREICGGRATGAEPGSMEVEFFPGEARGGEYSFAVGSAGSTALVLQAMLPALVTAPAPSQVTVEGGTHAKGAPPFEFLERALLPLVNRMGPHVTARLERHGFYPAGGGRVVVEITPAAGGKLAPIELRTRGKTLKGRACVVHSQLPAIIVERELEVIRRRLGWDVGPRDVRWAEPCFGPGNAVVLEMVSEGITEVFGVIGEPGKSAGRVAEEASEMARDYVRRDVPVGPHLADQLMVFMALAAREAGGAGVMVTGPLSGHSTTNGETIAQFLARPRVIGDGDRWEWRPG